MATLPTQVIPQAGLAPDFDPAAAGGDQCATGEGVLLHVNNAGAAPVDITVVTPQTVRGLAVEEQVVSCVNGVTTLVPVPDFYRDPQTGLASITYVDATSLTVAVTRS